jgi:hypothetical protein
MDNAGSFAMWGGVFSSVDCMLIYYRQKDDPWNAVIAGFITGGVLAFRGKGTKVIRNRWDECGFQECNDGRCHTPAD